MSAPLLFSVIDVTRQVFYRTPLSYAIVNLKPIVPGHVLVIPTRPVPRLSDLNPAEISSLFESVQKVGSAIERAYEADALTVACQDGKAAGQSIPHVHVHILPRRLSGDHFSGRNDDIYPVLESAEGELPRLMRVSEGEGVNQDGDGGRVKRNHDESSPIKVDADEDRPPRTMDEMEKEAKWLATFFA